MIFDTRLDAACAAVVSAEDREALLDHAFDGGHYASADVGQLMRQANLILDRQETHTVLRDSNG